MVEKQLFHLSQLSLLELNRPQSQTRGFHLENKSQYLKKITIEKLNFSVGDIVNYKDRKGNIIKVKISEINKNVSKGELPDITIQFKNGNVRETVINRISKLK